MPKSRSKRSSYIPPKPAKPKPSPRWVPVTGIAVIGIGLVLIILAYTVNQILPALFGTPNSWIIIGFVLMAGGLLILSRWR